MVSLETLSFASPFFKKMFRVNIVAAAFSAKNKMSMLMKAGTILWADYQRSQAAFYVLIYL